MDSRIVILINDVEVGFQFTMLTLEMICEREGIDYNELLGYASRKPLRVLNSIVACGNAKYEKKEPVDVDTADEWLDDIDSKELQKLWDHFEKTLVNILQRMEAMRSSDEGEDSEVKKKN